MKSLVLISFTLLTIITIVYGCNFYGDVNLGNGYYLWRDGKYREIVYNNSQKNGANGGYSIKRKNVVSYAKNDSEIFIKTSDYKNEEMIYEFFIIKKDELNVEECNNQKQVDSLFSTIIINVNDSILFYQILLNKGLSLKIE